MDRQQILIIYFIFCSTQKQLIYHMLYDLMLTVFAWSEHHFLFIGRERSPTLFSATRNQTEKIYKISYCDNFCLSMPPQMTMSKFRVKREIKKIIFCSNISNAYFWQHLVNWIILISPMNAEDFFSFPFPQSFTQIRNTAVCIWLIIVSIFENRVKHIYKSILYTWQGPVVYFLG